ncbi:MAG: hypothetical protein M1434_15580 [Chloroflexi bacterium]|nr:hypothetical protein [Chloroflexota bacterium]MCL5276140.1 hypothetical protein [Chloroflexota bacterium]
MAHRKTKQRKAPPSDEVAFRVSFERVFSSTLLNLAIIALVYFIVYIVLGLVQDRVFRAPPVSTVAVLVAAVLAISAGYGFIEMRRPRAILNPLGIQVRDTWGRLRFMAWRAIRRIEVENRPGTKVLVFYTDERPGDLVLPMILQDVAGLRETAVKYAGEDHPLVAGLDAVLEKRD